MKKQFVIFGTLIIAALSFTSCTKSLKDDVKELKKQNNDLKDRVNDVSNMLGTDEAINVTTTFKDYDNVERVVKQSMKFKSADLQSSSMLKNSDNSYDIEIERYGDIWGEDGVALRFNYNPATKAITDKMTQHYWNDYGNYNDNVYYDENYYDDGLSFNINIKSIDLNSGAISLDVQVSGTADYTNQIGDSWYIPARGAAINTSFSFEGKLKTYVREDD